MTPIQTQTVNTLKSEGFQVVEINRDIVRLTKGADARLVRRDGSQKRANHVLASDEPRKCAHGLRMNQSCFDCMSVLHGAKP